MLVERSYLHIRPGAEQAFAAAMAATGLPLLRSLDGARAVRFGPGVENPGTYMLLIDWADMDAHLAFTRDPRFAEFRALLAPFTTGGAMEHFTLD